MKILKKNYTFDELGNKVETLRTQLNMAYITSRDKDYILKISQELDEYIVLAQRYMSKNK